MCLYIQLNLPFVTPAEKEFCELSLGATWNFCIMVPIQIAYSVPSTVNITLNTWAKNPSFIWYETCTIAIQEN